MHRVSTKDLRNLGKYLQDLYALRTHAQFTDFLISSLSRLVDADVISYNEIHKDTGETIYKHAPRSFSPLPEGAEILSAFIHEHPIWNYWKDTKDLTPWRMTDFISSRAFRDLGIFKEFYDPLRIPHQIMMCIGESRDDGYPLGIHRGAKDFTERDRVLLSLVHPHINQAFSNAQLFSTLHVMLEQMHLAVDHLDQGILAVTEKGLVSWSSPRARSLLTRYFTVPRISNRLPETLWNWIGTQEQHLANSEEAGVEFQPLVIDRDSHQLRIRFIRDGGLKVVLFEEWREESFLEALTPLGLTLREIEVMQWVAQGKSNPEIAQILGLRPKTIEKHLERIYPKLGVENRHAASVCVTELIRHSSKNFSL